MEARIKAIPPSAHPARPSDIIDAAFPAPARAQRTLIPSTLTPMTDAPTLIIAHGSDAADSGNCFCAQCAELAALAKRHGWAVAPRSDLLRRRQISAAAHSAFLRRPDVVVAVGPGAVRAAVARALGLPAAAAADGMRLATFADVSRAIARAASGDGATAAARVAALPHYEPPAAPPPPPPPPSPPPPAAAASAGAAVRVEAPARVWERGRHGRPWRGRAGRGCVLGREGCRGG